MDMMLQYNLNMWLDCAFDETDDPAFPVDFSFDKFTDAVKAYFEKRPNLKAVAKISQTRTFAVKIIILMASDIIEKGTGKKWFIGYGQIQNWSETHDNMLGFNPIEAVYEYIKTFDEKKGENTMNTNTTINTEETLHTCYDCGESFDINDMHEVDGRYYCDCCFDERFMVCEDCGEIVPKESWRANYVDGYGWYCDDCFCEKFAECADCGGIYEIDEMIRVGDEYYCEDCIENDHVQCDRCGEWVRDDEAYTVYIDDDRTQESWCENCASWNTWTCEECGERYSDDVDHDDNYICPCCEHRAQSSGDIKLWRAPSGVRSYSFKPTPCFCFMPDQSEDDGKSIPLGFELEVDKPNRDTDNNAMADFVNGTSGYTYVKRDGSLDSGMEIVSHPATLEYHMSKKDTWGDIFDQLLSDGGYTSHDAGTCGLHVHISLKALEDKNPNAVNNMLFIMDHFWSKFVKFSRRTESQLDHWARRYSRMHGDYEDWKRQAKGTRDRYYALNLQNKYTVEIRMFRGTLNLDTFIATLQFVDVLCRKCIEITDLRVLQALTWLELVESPYEELNAYLKKRGLIGTLEEMEAAEEAERKAKEEKERKEAEERERRRQERIEAENRANDELRQLRELFPIGALVEIVAVPDEFTQLLGCNGHISRVSNDSTMPIQVDFRGFLEEGFSACNNHRYFHLHYGEGAGDYYWNCPVNCVRVISEDEPILF